MKILITGGTGFLGRHVVARLAGRHSLRLLVRPRASRERFPPTVEFAPGDVTDPASLVLAVQGCDAVLHAAALVKIMGTPEEYDRVNLDGFDNVLSAASEAGVRKIVYVSSFIALGPSERGPDGLLDETAEPQRPPWINDYARTKALCDRRARRAIADGVPLCVVYPGVLYGPGEMTEGNIVVRHLLDLLHRRLPMLIGAPHRRWSYVHVDDAAGGTEAVLENEEVGVRYVLGGENVRLDEFYGTVERLSGVPVPRWRMPNSLAKMAGAMAKLEARWRGKTPKLTPDLVEIYRHDWAYNSARAIADLRYTARPLADGLAATLTWLRETGQWRPVPGAG
jgi:NAD+-dependent farnesol dehydrogenase